MFAMQMAASVMNAILNNQLRVYGGDLAISVIGIIHSVALFIAMPIFGLNQGAQPIIGYNYGAQKYDRVKKNTAVGHPLRHRHLRGGVRRGHGVSRASHRVSSIRKIGI